MIVDGIVLAGGASRRMGVHKPLLPFAGGRLIDAVIASAARQVRRLAVNVPRAMARDYPYADVVPDLYDAPLGPLCGVVTGLDWLTGDWLATFPCDTPFLPRDLVAQLARAAGDGPVVAVQDGRVQAVCALWPKRVLPELRAELARFRSMRATLQALDAVEVEIAAPEHAFFNVNAPRDLAEAERLRAQAD